MIRCFGAMQVRASGTGRGDASRSDNTSVGTHHPAPADGDGCNPSDSGDKAGGKCAVPVLVIIRRSGPLRAGQARCRVARFPRVALAPTRQTGVGAKNRGGRLTAAPGRQEAVPYKANQSILIKPGAAGVRRSGTSGGRPLQGRKRFLHQTGVSGSPTFAGGASSAPTWKPGFSR